MARLALPLCLALLALTMAGCPPRVVVKKNPGPLDRGVRYYRPKPYLLLTPYQQQQIADKTTLIGPPSDQYVTISLEYLPDFSEEYSVHVRTGLGTADVELQLKDGWNLTTLNQNLDSQFDENLSAIADLISAVAPEGVVPALDATQKVTPVPAAVVRATNVPLGYYEAVIGQNRDGAKQLFGWRYIGFLPYAPCPLAPSGIECPPCETLDLYGLVFDNGTMTFKPLFESQQMGQSGNYLVEPHVSQGSP